MSVGRSAASKIDWTTISSSLGLKGQTASSLLAFKKRNDDARRKLAALQAAPQTVDFNSYRSVLRNTAVIDEIQAQVKNFKPTTYDVERQIKAIEAFEVQAVKDAEETKSKVDAEMVSLERTLTNIETARPLGELKVHEVCAAAPEIEKYVERLVSRGRWHVPKYREKVGDLAVV